MKSQYKKILFVEDSEAFQKTFGEILTQEGFVVVNAGDGEAGITMAKKEKPDLILLDLILPKKDGFSVLQELKSDEHTRSIPVIVLSQLESSEDIQRAIEGGATSYLIKADYKPDEIVTKVRQALKLK